MTTGRSATSADGTWSVTVVHTSASERARLEHERAERVEDGRGERGVLLHHLGEDLDGALVLRVLHEVGDDGDELALERRVDDLEHLAHRVEQRLAVDDALEPAELREQQLRQRHPAVRALGLELRLQRREHLEERLRHARLQRVDVEQQPHQAVLHRLGAEPRRPPAGGRVHRHERRPQRVGVGPRVGERADQLVGGAVALERLVHVLPERERVGEREPVRVELTPASSSKPWGTAGPAGAAGADFDAATGGASEAFCAFAETLDPARRAFLWG